GGARQADAAAGEPAGLTPAKALRVPEWQFHCVASAARNALQRNRHNGSRLSLADPTRPIMLLSLLSRKFGQVVKSAHSRLELREGEDWFVNRGHTPDERRLRSELARSFRHVTAHVKCAHSDLEVLRMADFLLSSPLPGPVVECGCYKG